MRKLLLTLLFIIPSVLMAINVPSGTFYFDNTKTGYSNVKFVYGNSSESVTHVISLTKGENNLWQLVIDAAAYNQTHYFFTNTALNDGVLNQSVTTIKDLIVNRGERRTQTFKDVDNVQMAVGATFVPDSGDQYTSGRWTGSGPDPGTKAWSGTLPVLFIDTENSQAITSKEEYISATCYVVTNGTQGCPETGTKDEPLTLSVKGRGNWTWKGFDKKPYRLKLSTKAPLLGMKKSKHFVLMAGADDNLGFMRNPLGYELSRRMQLAWTPDARPVEVVLNGDYIGFYLLTENVRVDADRVNVTEQDDNSDADVTGGWLVEVDNYNTDPHISVRVTDKPANGNNIWITYKSPEILSDRQRDYLQQQFDAIRDGVYNSDRSSQQWEKYVDLYAMARVYVVRELMHDEEGFHGSFYLHKQKGEDAKWIAGPVWDFGNAYNRGPEKFIWDRPEFECFFIDQIYQFPRFVEAVKNVFGDFYRDQYSGIDTYIDTFSRTISSAAVSDHRRWPQYGTSDISGKARAIKDKLHAKVNWLVRQWGTTGTGIQDIIGENASPLSPSAAYYDIQGRRLSHAPEHGLYIVVINGKAYKHVAP